MLSTPKLSEMLERQIFIRALALDENNPVFVKLVAVENGGIWIESQKQTTEILKWFKRSSAPRTPVFFLPFASIAWISFWIDVPAISDEVLGS